MKNSRSSLRTVILYKYILCSLSPGSTFLALTALLASLIFFPNTASAIVDLDADTLDDIWEARYNAQSVLPGDDEDGDDKTNIQECMAGTDPFDATDFLNIGDATITDTSGSLTIATKAGKLYAVQISADLVNWTNEGTVIYGTGGDVNVALSSTASTDLTGSIFQEIWTGITGGTVTNLTGSANYPDTPSGSRALPNLETPENVDDNYGGRIRGYIKPPMTGLYNFAISSRNFSQLWLSTDDGPASATQIAAVNSSAILSGDADKYTRFASQQSIGINLVAGQKYYVEVLHKHAGQEDHCSVAWSGPGLPAGLNLITGEYLCPLININASSLDQIVEYRLDENTGTTAGDTALGNTDPAGGANDGSLVGGATWADGVAGSGVQLDGALGTQIDIADSTDINTATHGLRTISLWFKADNPSAAAKQVLFEEGGSVNGMNIYLDTGVLYVGAWVGVTAGIPGSDPEDFFTYLSTPFTDTGWHHVTLVLNASGAATPVADAFKGYLDGTEFGSGTAAQVIAHGGNTYIGANGDGTVFHDGSGATGPADNFAGCVDEFGLWNRALSVEEIGGLAALSTAPLGGTSNHMRVTAIDMDSDGDTLTDWSEIEMSGEGNFSPYDPDSVATPGGDDLAIVTAALTFGGGPDSVNVVLADANAYEDPRNSNNIINGTPQANLQRNPARFRVRRSTLQPLSVQYTLGGPALPEATALNGTDYNEQDVHGNAISGTLNLGFGHVTGQIVIDPIQDFLDPPTNSILLHEPPEHIRCQLIDAGGPGAGDYDLGGATQQTASLFDALDVPEQEILFVGNFIEDENQSPGTPPIVANGFAAARLTGDKKMLRVWNVFENLTSIQTEGHLHKMTVEGTGGSTKQTTGLGDKGPIFFHTYVDPEDNFNGALDPPYFIGDLSEYPVDLTQPESAAQEFGTGGTLSHRAVVDGLFLQDNGGSIETPIYINVHTAENNGGEVMAILLESDGTVTAPPEPTQAEIGYPVDDLSDPGEADELEMDVRRFLDQATFGAREADVQALLAEVNGTHGGDRIAAFDAWIDAQIAEDQTILKDFVLAADWIEMRLRGYFDPNSYIPDLMTSTDPQSKDDTGAPLGVPVDPGTAGGWPSISYGSAPTGGGGLPATEQWLPSAGYPVHTRYQQQLLDNELTLPNNQSDLGQVNDSNRRRGMFTIRINAKDQLRQKMGDALQQINVISSNLLTIRNFHVGTANYFDQINHRAFGNYRDVIDWVWWSPQMGRYLSSLKNQKTVWEENPAGFTIQANIDATTVQAGDNNATIIAKRNGTTGVTEGPLVDLPDTKIFEPDENLARELMQLFTIGLFELHPDGSLLLSGETGLPQATYDNFGIEQAARLHTGIGLHYYLNDPDGGGPMEVGDNWNSPLENNNFARGDGNRYVDATYSYRMKMFEDFHDEGIDYFTLAVDPFQIAGGKTIDNTSISNDFDRAMANVKEMLDWFAGNVDGGHTLTDNFNGTDSHPSVPAFVAFRLIQHFVSDNPSRDYIHHVALAFTRGFDYNFDGDTADGNDEPGGGGDLRAAIKAVLLHPEARKVDSAPALDPYGNTKIFADNYGQKQWPIDAYFKVIRALDMTTEYPIIDDGAGTYGTGAANIFHENFSYPIGQQDNFTHNCIYRYNDTDLTNGNNINENLSMSLYRQETVFNFGRPFYSPSGAIANAGLVSPKFQLANTNSVVQNNNYFEQLVHNNAGQGTAPYGVVNTGTMIQTGIDKHNIISIDSDPIPAPPNAVANWKDNVMFENEFGTGWELAFDALYRSNLVGGMLPAHGGVDVNNDGSVNNIDRRYLGDELFINTLDKRLMAGRLLAKYGPYNELDDATDPDGLGPLLPPGPNPRELIIKLLHDNTAETNPNTNLTNWSYGEKRDIIQDALYLMTGLPEFLIRK